MAIKDDFDGQMSMFGMDDMGFETIGITGGEDFFEEDDLPKVSAKKAKKDEPKEKEEAVLPEEAGEPDGETAADSTEASGEQPILRKPSLPKIKIEGVFPCMGCGKLLTKTVEGDKFKVYCNNCNVSYSGNN